MHEVLYIVTATIPDEALAREYLEWLNSGHVHEVVESGGASWGRALRVVDPAEPIRVESHYLFDSMARYENYVSTHANRLRAEGLQRFPAEKGIRFERRVCEVRSHFEAPGFRVD